MAYKIVVLAGDGIGPEVIREAIKVLKATEDAFGLEFDLVPYPAGGKHYMETGEEWPDGAFESSRNADAILLGAVGYPGAILPDGNLAGAGVVFGLRFGLDLYANVRPAKLYPKVKHKVHNRFRKIWDADKVDFVIVRENTEGLYPPIRGVLERGGIQELAIDNRVITRKGAERVIRFAFEESLKRQGAPKDGKRRVTCVDKSNVMDGDRLFRKIYDELAEEYPTVERDYAFVDAFMQWMIRTPEAYDVAVMSNMFGDIATDLASVLQGGMGLAAGGNVGDEHAMFEPIHGSAPKYEGKDRANPTAAVLAVQMMLRWLGEKKSNPVLEEAAATIEMAVEAVLQEGKFLTQDLGGKAKTSQTGDALADRVTSLASSRG
ncbi:MAG: isocitrate/isopropylmalate dehydrogenase family protein [Thermoplasmata archaeon]